jgi:tetratricopeptide (TPR) repeat protein
MITFTLAFALALQQAEPIGQIVDWPTAIASSPRKSRDAFELRLSRAMKRSDAGPAAAKHAKAQPPGASAAPGSAPQAPPLSGFDREPGVVSYNPMPYEDLETFSKEVEAHASKVEAESDACLEMARKGDLDGAKRQLKSFLLTEPYGGYALLNLELLGVPLLDIQLEHGEYAAAYDVASSFIRGGNTSEDLMLRASLASACLGQVYPGQREYCMQRIIGGNGNGTVAEAMPKGDTPEILAFLSGMAIGCRMEAGRESDAIAYLEQALKLDPANPYACLFLGDDYAKVGCQYSKAIRVLQDGLTRAKPGTLRAKLVYSLRVYQWDRWKAGDGNPALPQKNWSRSDTKTGNGPPP